MKKEIKLSVFSVVKNEEKMIEDSLKSMEGADEIVIIDTGSTDKTIKIAKKYTDKIFTDYKWRDNFSEAKNYAIHRCSGEWIVGLDADCRFEKNGAAKIKEMIRKHGDKHSVLNLRVVPLTIENRNKIYHFLPKVFKKAPEHFYYGRVHEAFSRVGYGEGDVAVVFLNSPNHKKDPNRNIRILLEDIKANPHEARWKFYLGREYFLKGLYLEAIYWLDEYLKIGKSHAEISNVYLVKAFCYWKLREGDLASINALHAIRINPNYKRAFLFMSDIHPEPWKSKWKQMADLATNEGVLFKDFN
jgi:glycosyltransferase involved in cell wall biosynthesis